LGVKLVVEWSYASLKPSDLRWTHKESNLCSSPAALRIHQGIPPGIAGRHSNVFNPNLCGIANIAWASQRFAGKYAIFWGFYFSILDFYSHCHQRLESLKIWSLDLS
jgi:hypothetical protein